MIFIISKLDAKMRKRRKIKTKLVYERSKCDFHVTLIDKYDFIDKSTAFAPYRLNSSKDRNKNNRPITQIYNVQNAIKLSLRVHKRTYNER